MFGAAFAYNLRYKFFMMNRISFRLLTVVVLSAVFFFTSCSNSNTDEEATTSDTVITYEPVDTAEGVDVSVNKSNAIWSVDLDSSTNEFHLVKNKNVRADTLTAQTLVNSVNAAWQPLSISLLNVHHDTVTVKLNDEEVVNENMGSSGSEQFLAAVTYTLTELKNIHYVQFNFARGDHAQPGVYSREDFIDYMRK